MMRSTLVRLAERAGIEVAYEDTWGQHHEASDATLRALLDAMGLPADDDDAVRTSMARLDAHSDTSPTLSTAAARAWQPASLAGGGRRWGLAVQLYSLHTPRTWGIGDFSALADLITGAAALGACTVGINPLHALFPARPEQASPYSPSSRRFVNPLYLDVEAVDGYADCMAARRLVESTGFQARLDAVRAAPLIPYTAVSELKYSVLSVVYSYFREHCLTRETHPLAVAFREFQQHQGPRLRRFATFQALADTLPEIDWRRWPNGLDDPDSPAVAAFATRNEHAVVFHEYLQWQATRQLESVNDRAHGCGMSIGLCADLAVGVDPGGATCWGTGDWMARGVAIGAPPDALNLSGQNWGLPPPDPLAMQATNYARLAELWGHAMHHAGALRIDHIPSLVRLYWIPHGTVPADGAYVRYPSHDLFRLLASASRHHQCMVIGEDLGTMPQGLRQTMQSLDILAYRLLYFEQPEGRFRPPGEYPAEALVATGTHDLPPLPMWWNGEDIDLRERLELWPDAAACRAARGQRQRERDALTAALRAMGLHDAGTPETAPVEAIYAYLARTPCKLLMVQLEDVLDVHTQVNVPGTVDQHPNWRRRLPSPVDAILADPRMQRIATALNAEGRDDR